MRPTPPIYELKELIGQGTSGCVYRAIRSDREGAIHQEVAIKVLNSKNSVIAWNEEFKSLSTVSSERCVRVFGFEWMADRPALVLELIRGVSLSSLLRSTVLSKREIYWIGQEVLHGLRDLAKERLVHGDLSPNNIMITLDGEIRLLDFGFGNLNQRRLTPEYAAPEVLAGGKADHAADLYSLGKVLLRSCGPSLHLGVMAENLMQTAPQARVWSGSIVKRPRSLGRKVQCEMENQKARDGKTSEERSLNPPQRRRNRITARASAAMMTILLLSLDTHTAVGRTAPLAKPSASNAAVSIRSNFGIEIEFDGRKVGFAPLDLSDLKPGDYILGWNFKGRRQQRTLTLKRGDHIVVDDQVLINP